MELGAQVIHGSKAATWELIKEFGIETRPSDSFGEPDYHYFSAAGGKPGINVHSFPWLMTKVGSSCRDYRGPDLSYQAFVDTLGLTAEDAQLLTSESISWSAEPNRISLKSVVEHGKLWENWRDQDFQLVGGYGRLAKKMAADLKGKIQLHSKVDEVCWRGGIAGVSYRDRGSSAAQELSDLGPEAGLARVLRWLQEASGFDDLASKLPQCGRFGNNNGRYPDYYRGRRRAAF